LNDNIPKDYIDFVSDQLACSRQTSQHAEFMVSALVRSIALASLLSISTTAAFSVLFTSSVRAQSLPTPQEAQPNLEDLRPLAQDGSILSMRGGQRLITEAGSAAAAQNYDLAVDKLQEARQVFNQLSNFYQELAASFSGIDNRIADVQRRQALDAAQYRDQATYQLALVHRAQNKPELAVPLLVQIIRSQQPTRELGQQAYRQLLELGFVDSPYPRSQEEPTSSAPAPTRSN
jgi:hypothetical protein